MLPKQSHSVTENSNVGLPDSRLPFNKEKKRKESKDIFDFYDSKNFREASPEQKRFLISERGVPKHLEPVYDAVRELSADKNSLEKAYDFALIAFGMNVSASQVREIFGIGSKYRANLRESREFKPLYTKSMSNYLGAGVEWLKAGKPDFNHSGINNNFYSQVPAKNGTKPKEVLGEF